MPRPLQRVRLESGLKLNVNRLVRRGFIKPGAFTGPVGITWTEKCTGHEIASGLITADMGGNEGWFRIKLGHLDQRIMLTTKRRHFGGRQWYFVCPYTNRPASVLWKPEMEAAGRLRIAIHGPRRKGSSGRGYDQIEALLSWWLRP